MDNFISIILFFYEMLDSVELDGISLLVFVVVAVLGGELLGVIVNRLIG